MKRPTENDLRVLAAVKQACAAYDGYAPHGPADWTAIRRLLVSGLVVDAGTGICQDCDTPAHRREPTEVQIYALTDAGRALLDEIAPPPVKS